ncbi:protein FAR1-RELATED SEQUENCE 5-like [Helianthus annuus]|uniref:protein FAR1-RELATED SEQUENCE 5-like n=1 Tax=Helianthus annuus TaxID=4232 RepID=UPI0016533AD3|nr:protein FAR1-RELATED SEQUENCE 5-like [Helianthus annuus]
MVFSSLDDCYSMYVKYAKECGFSVKKGTTKTNSKGVLHIKYYLCTRSGLYKDKKVDTLDPNQKERVVGSNFSKRTDCGALLCVLFEDGSWKVYKFVEEHNHELVERPDKHFLPTKRHLTQLQKHVIHNMSKLNLGPVKEFNVMKTCFGGSEDVGASKVEFKNYKMQINLFIGEYDTDMVVKHLNEKKHSQPNFSYGYITNEVNRLKGLSWCDDQAKRNYHVFGDVISFDAMYRSNKYSMVFVPVTGIDNHHCNVTFGAALLASETADTYIWLLRVFLKAVGSQPKVVVNDQDPAMKKAISVVFVDTRHRLCMWHVMHKLSLKVGVWLCNSTNFKERICRVVWTNILTPEEFESEWEAVIAEFNLEDNNWLSDIFAIRESWIPAYYRMEHMSGLMRTTSRSDSENRFFGQVCNSKATLVEFMTHYETAIEAQRHTHPELIGVADCINQRYEDQPDGQTFYAWRYRDIVFGVFQVQDMQIVVPPASSRDRFAEITGQYKNDKNPIRVPVGYKSKGSGSRKSRETHVAKQGCREHYAPSLLAFSWSLSQASHLGQIIPPRNILPTAIDSDNRRRPPAPPPPPPPPPPTLYPSPATLTAL